LLVVRRFCCRANSSIRYSFALSNNIKLFSFGVTRETVRSTFLNKGTVLDRSYRYLNLRIRLLLRCLPRFGSIHEGESDE
jgi:hypothetical protein